MPIQQRMSVGLTGEEMSVIYWFYKVDNLHRRYRGR